MHLANKLQAIPSGSHFERLVNCRVSHALSIEARRLGQVAHEDSEAARQGTRIHEALDTGNLEFLSPEEPSGLPSRETTWDFVKPGRRADILSPVCAQEAAAKASPIITIVFFMCVSFLF